METKPAPKARFVDEYDFVFQGGMVKQISVDSSIGDTIEFVNGGVKIFLAARQAIGNPDEIIQSQDITIFSQHLFSIDHQKRLVQEQSPDQRYEWFQTIKEATKSVH